MSNVVLNAGVGGATLGTDQVAGIDYQKVKVTFSTDGTVPTSVDATHGLPGNLIQVGGNTVKSGSGAGSSGSLNVYLATDQPSLTNALAVSQSGSWTVTISGTVTTSDNHFPASAALSDALANPTTTQLGANLLGWDAANTVWRRVQVTSATGKLLVDGSTVTQPISAASLPLPTGASTSAKQPALGVAGTPSTDVLTIQGAAAMTKLLVTPDSVALPANQSVNLNQAAGTALDVNSGNKSAGTIRVVLATDQPSLTNAQPVTQSGTFTVQIGNTPNTTPILTTNVPGTAPGSTPSRVKAAATTNATSLKASAGVVLSYALYNNTASAKYFKFYNKASAPTVGTDTPLFDIIIPASGGANIDFANGVPFSTGIAFAITGGVADSDTTATAVDDVHGVVVWK